MTVLLLLLAHWRQSLRPSKTLSYIRVAVVRRGPSLPSTIAFKDAVASTTFAFSAADELLALHNWYQRYHGNRCPGNQRYHGYLASVVCVFGIVANTLNIVVLTRPNMAPPGQYG